MQTSPMFQQQPIMVSTVEAPPHRTMPILATKVLGILQIVMGGIICATCIAFLAAVKLFWLGNVGFGIWTGLWVCIANCLLYILWNFRETF